MTTYSIIYLIGAIILLPGVFKTIKAGKQELELKKEKETSREWTKEPELQSSTLLRKKYLKISLAALGIMYLAMTFISFL